VSESGLVAEPQAAAEVAATIADRLVSACVSNGIDTVFGVGGTHTLQLLGAIEREPALRYVASRTEIGAAYMAMGYARVALRPAVVLTSTGPGALNITGVLQDAEWAAVPLIHLTTHIGDADFAGAVHETPKQPSLLSSAGKAYLSLDGPAVDTVVRATVEAAMSHPRGPVTIDVAAGMWFNEASPSETESAEAMAPDEDLTRELAPLLDELAHARRPIVYVGGGACKEDGGASALELAERLGAPIITSYQGKAVASWEHDLYLGPWATEPMVRELCQDADLALVLGSKLSDVGTAHWTLPLPATVRRIDASGSSHPRYSQMTTIQVDAARAARFLNRRLNARPTWAPDRLEQVRKAVVAAAQARGPLEFAFVQALGADASWRLATETTKGGFWAMKFLPATAGSVHAFSSYLAMGSALPMAIGMAVADDAPVTVLVGDGGLQMSLAELATLVEYKLPINIVVIVDHAYGLLQDNSQRLGGSNALGVTLWNPDFAMLCRAYGISCDEAATPGRLAELLASPPDAPRMILIPQGFSRQW
jgi:acetolactate synthase I/II/III large subunit